jgi:hypothetical protein
MRMPTLQEIRDFLRRKKGKELTNEELLHELNGYGLISLKEEMERLTRLEGGFTHDDHDSY